MRHPPIDPFREQRDLPAERSIVRDQNENIPRRINFLHLPHRPHRRIVIREQRSVRHSEERRIGSLR